MKKFAKYIFLIAFAFVASIAIYKYIEANEKIQVEKDILIHQNQLEQSFLSFSKNATLENPKVILNPYGNSPLTALIIFKTNDLTTPTITIKGNKDSDDLIHTFIPSKIHILPIYGLYENYNNEVIVDVSGNKKTINIQTEKLPDDFVKMTNIEKDIKTNDFYFTTSEDKKYTLAYDCNGNVRWYLKGDYKWEIQRLNNGHLLISDDKLINSPYYSKGLMEIDLLGKIYYQYNIPNGYHHSVIELDNGNFLLASNNFNDGTVEDYIIELDRNSGNIVKQWNLHKLQNNDKENWLGLNSLIYDKKNNSITFTGKNNNMIANIDYNTGQINWIISEKKNVPEKYYKYILNNDEIQLPNEPESINILDNGNLAFVNTKNDNIYLTIYNIDLNKKTVNMVDEIFLHKKTKANIDIKNKDNYILTGENFIKEHNDNDDLIIETNSSLYNSKKMSLYANDIYKIGKGVKLGELGITPTEKNVSTLIYKNGENIIKKHKLTFVKETDRLVVSGKFNTNDEIKLILDNFLTKRTYDIVVSETPYKNKQNSKEITVTKYINDEDIYGKFYIYIRINGVNYKLGKYVTF